MFRVACSKHMRTAFSMPRLSISGLSSSSRVSSSHPNAPLDLDPGLQALLKDVDMSLARRKPRHGANDIEHPLASPRELEAFPSDQYSDEDTTIFGEDVDEADTGHRKGRKSPAALFGSQRLGAVTIPFELQNKISLLIAESDKAQLHNDAKRLFFDSEGESGSERQWETQYDAKYRSRRQAARHSERDGTAFASIALPAHYSVIYSVLDHVKRRLGPGWNVERVIDWGAGTGSGLWASLHSFQRCPPAGPDAQLSHSSVVTYLGLDKREGLVSIGKRLLQNMDLGSLSLSWQKSFHDDNKIRRSEGRDTLALSAFMLSSLPTPLARKTMVKEIWESGADVMVLIDHNSSLGFECIAEAREYLLNVGRKEFNDPASEHWESRGSHVIAPCPHDGTCPLYHPGSNRLVCGFSQRLQRPSFVRLTKHSGIGHENVGYSYVVIRRGARPSPQDTKVGRIGDVGKWALAKEASIRPPMKELVLHGEHEEVDRTGTEHIASSVPSASIAVTVSEASPEATSDGMDEMLRQEAFGWPRLVFPPLKKSGHIILDCCTAEGKIMRHTIPKSQGKQPYYDARKSSWGDIFPHEPKNAPQERYQPTRAKRQGGTTATKGADIGKRGAKLKTETEQKASYEALSRDLKEQRRQSRRERVRNLA